MRRGFVGAVSGVVLASSLACGISTVPSGDVDVCVPTHDLSAGHRITEADLRWVELPPEFVSENALAAGDPVVGRVLRESVLAFEFLRDERFETEPVGVALGDPVDLVLPFGLGEQAYGHEAIAGVRAARSPDDLMRTLTRIVITT